MIFLTSLRVLKNEQKKEILHSTCHFDFFLESQQQLSKEEKDGIGSILCLGGEDRRPAGFMRATENLHPHHDGLSCGKQ
jgi:hypothetical protein